MIQENTNEQMMSAQFLNLFGKSFTISELIQKIIYFKDFSGQILINKFSIQLLISYFDRSKIDKIQKVYINKTKGLDIVQFVRFFLNAIDHKQDQTLYLTIALIDMFKQISEHNNMTNYIKFVQITDFLCFKTIDQTTDINTVKTKLLPQSKRIQPTLQIRQIDINAPIIFGRNDSFLRKLSKGVTITDSSRHNNGIKNAFYCKQIKKVITLDSLSDSLGIYNLNCELQSIIKPNNAKIKKDIIIMSFAYSQRQKRIGAVMKDYNISFWDANDNFSFEKSFSVSNCCSQYQYAIWYLQQLCMWITTDNSFQIYIWDIQNQEIKKKIVLKYKTRITDLCQIPYLKLIAIGLQKSILDTNSNKIQNSKKMDPNKKNIFCQSNVILWNILKQTPIVQIKLPNQRAGVHTLTFFNTYQVLLTVGFQNKINVFQIESKYFDCTLKGRLIGHSSLVTTIACIQKSPMVLTGDDEGGIKIWDIRRFKCIQALDLGKKTIINKLLNMIDVEKVAFIGSRLNYIDLEDKNWYSQNKNQQQLYPLKAQYNPSQQQIVICTRKDVRFYSFHTGKIKQIYSDFFDQKEEITIFKNIQNSKRFILGNHKGQLKLYSILTGQLINNLQGHTNQISGIKIDYANKLYISSGWDSNLIIQKETGSKFQILRQYRNNFYKKQIAILQISVYHNLIAIGSNNDNYIYFWDYQLAKLRKSIMLQQDQQPTAFAFINGLSIFILFSNLGNSYYMHFKKLQNSLDFKILAYHKINYDKTYATQTAIDVTIDNNNSKVYKSNIFVSTNKGYLIGLSLMKIFKCFNIPIEKHENTRLNYNAYRQIDQNFISQITKHKFQPFIIDLQTKLIWNKSNMQRVNLNDCQIINLKAHKDSINYIGIIDLNQKYIITCSIDSKFKIWKINGQKLCDCNINVIFYQQHPLPMKWSIQVDKFKKIKNKILFALKIIQIIFKKYGNDISIGESRCIRINNFLQKLSQQQIFLTKSQQNSFLQKQKIRLFRDEFSARDLNYDFIRKIYFKQIAGPSLKQMEVTKRITQIQKSWRINKKLQDKNFEQRLKALEQYHNKALKMQQRQQILQFLDAKNKQTYNSNQYLTRNKNSLVYKIQKKLKKNVHNDPNKQKNITQESKRIQQIKNKKQQTQVLSRVRKRQSRQIQNFQQYYFTKNRGFKFQQNINNKQTKLNRNILIYRKKKNFFNIIRKMNLCTFNFKKGINKNMTKNQVQNQSFQKKSNNSQKIIMINQFQNYFFRKFDK